MPAVDKHDTTNTETPEAKTPKIEPMTPQRIAHAACFLLKSMVYIRQVFRGLKEGRRHLWKSTSNFSKKTFYLGFIPPPPSGNFLLLHVEFIRDMFTD